MGSNNYILSYIRYIGKTVYLLPSLSDIRRLLDIRNYPKGNPNIKKINEATYHITRYPSVPCIWIQLDIRTYTILYEGNPL